MLLSLIPPDLTTNTQACADYIQVSSGTNAEEINNISRHAVVPIELQVTRTDDPMVFLHEKGMEKSSRNIILQAAVYDAVRKRTVIPIQKMNKECMLILHQNKEILVNNENPSRKPDPSLGIYLTADKLAQ